MLPEIFARSDKVLNVAHRGASAQFPENTLPAFRAAIAQHADMIELDVQWTKDRIPVIFHDHTLKYHTNGRGQIKDLTLQELKQLDAGAWFGNTFTGTRIPTLEEVLQLVDKKIALNIEIKTEAVADKARRGIEWECMRLVKKYKMTTQVLFSSFDMRALGHFKNYFPDMPLGILYSKKGAQKRSPLQMVQDYKAKTFNCSYFHLSRSLVRTMHQHNIPVMVYTLNSIKRMQKVIKMGVDGIFTNKPDRLAKLMYPNDEK